MGAEFDAFWLADGPVGEGRALNGMGFNAALRDFARLGQLMLDGGMANGERILPEGWVARMTAMKPTGGGRPGYGFQTWQIDREPGAFAALTEMPLDGKLPARVTVRLKGSGSAAEDSAWREILDYFSEATQIGMTATPKETKYISNIAYFGTPVFTYSLRQGISASLWNM